jgi:hypothetical protein
MNRTATSFAPGPVLTRPARPARPAATAPSLHDERTAQRLALMPRAALATLGARTLRLLRADD